jgi:hypothetical protein
MLLDVQLVQE